MTIQKITPVAGVALRKVFQLLEDQFDAESGSFKDGWSDDRIAKETSISRDAVKNYRVNAFGKIKPPGELEVLRRELGELEHFALRTENEIKNKVKDLTLRLSAIERRFD
jgi:hypothetical protein